MLITTSYSHHKNISWLKKILFAKQQTTTYIVTIHPYIVCKYSCHKELSASSKKRGNLPKKVSSLRLIKKLFGGFSHPPVPVSPTERHEITYFTATLTPSSMPEAA